MRIFLLNISGASLDVFDTSNKSNGFSFTQIWHLRVKFNTPNFDFHSGIWTLCKISPQSLERNGCLKRSFSWFKSIYELG